MVTNDPFGKKNTDHSLHPPFAMFTSFLLKQKDAASPQEAQKVLERVRTTTAEAHFSQQ